MPRWRSIKTMRLGAAHVAIAYASVGALWILLSDMAIEGIFSDQKKIIQISLVKGWFFVATTAALIYALVRRLIADREKAHQQVDVAFANSQRARDLLTNIINSSEDAIFAKDLQGRYLLMNNACARFTGKPADSLIGQDDYAIFPREQAEMLIAGDHRVIAAELAEFNEETLITSSGERIFLATKGPLRNEQGRISGVFGISKDVTEQRKIQRSLQKSEHRFQQIVEASADWIWEVDAECRYTYASESVQAILGYTPAELLGKTPFEFMPADEADLVRKAFFEHANQKLPFRDLDNINVCKSGELRHIWTTGMPILGEDGTLLGYRGLDRDITEKKRAEERLVRTRDLLHSVLNSLPDLIWLKDAEGRYIACNARFEEFFGAPESSIKGKTDYDFVSREQADSFRKHDRIVLETGTSKDNEEEITFASDGHSEIIQTIKTPYYNSQRKPVGVLGIGRDITKRKLAEAELKERNEELERFNRTTIGREMEVIAMKKKINQLCKELGREPPYPLAFLAGERAEKIP
jgi:PAS domain S-box-containing protein